MLIFLKVAWCIDKNITCRLKGFLSGSMSQDISTIYHWTVHLRIPSFSLIMCIMRLCGLQNTQQFWAVILTAVSVLSVCLFVFCPYYLFHFLSWIEVAPQYFYHLLFLLHHELLRWTGKFTIGYLEYSVWSGHCWITWRIPRCWVTHYFRRIFYFLNLTGVVSEKERPGWLWFLKRNGKDGGKEDSGEK